jgi:hypothetical protein
VTHLAGCERFWLWALAGALFSFSFVAALSIGIFVLPFALVALYFATRNGVGRGEPLGALAGVGATCLLIAALNLGSDGGSLDARPWLAAGLLFAAVGMAGYALVSRCVAPPA